MIEIKVKKLSEKEASASIMSASANASADAIAKILKQKLKDYKCKKHPEKTSIITIVADKKKITKFEKTYFCCSDFEKQIKLSTDLEAS